MLRFIALISLLSAVWCGAKGFKLQDGTVLCGKIVESTPDSIFLESSHLGRVALGKKQLADTSADGSCQTESPSAELQPLPGETVVDSSAIASTEPQVSNPERKGPSKAAVRQMDPSGHSLIFLPTAFTQPKGTVVFRDFELLFLTFGFSPTDGTSLTVGAMFPVTTEFNLLTLGVKQQLYRNPDQTLALALTGSVSQPLSQGNKPDPLWNSNLIASIQSTPEAGFHATVGYFQSGSDGSDGSWVFGGGGDLVVTPNAKFLVEYLGSSELIDHDFKGLINFGVRLHSRNLGADICAVKPLAESNDLVFLPLISIAYRF